MKRYQCIACDVWRVLDNLCRRPVAGWRMILFCDDSRVCEAFSAGVAHWIWLKAHRA